MGLNNYSYKYLDWACTYNSKYSRIVTCFITLVTKSHEPLCRDPYPKALGTHLLRLLGPKAILFRAFWRE